MLKYFVQMCIRLLQKEKSIAEATTCDLTVNKNADKITKASKTSQKTIKSETENIEFDRKMSKEICIPSEKSNNLLIRLD